MTSLLERMNVTPGPTGPIRNGRGGQSSRSSTPYNRPGKGNSDKQWSHDMFERENNLGARLNVAPIPGVPVRTRLFVGGVEGATGGHLTIKGASTGQDNTVEVSGLVAGTTADDVKTIFKRCGEIISAKSVPGGGELKIRVTFKNPKDAQTAVRTFDKQQADGKTLSVHVVGFNAAPILANRLQGANGMSIAKQEGSVDILMGGSADSGSKMRSDAMIQDPRAQVLVAPPGTDPKDYTQSRGSGRGRGRGGRGRRGGGGDRRGGGRGKKMDID
ncbi:hypothetical protein CPB85DRAFT_1376449 [Mucidula mucida]|nr:hypothetical protein CPB85DRAFT_1376449 [Mucidula mucida]